MAQLLKANQAWELEPISVARIGDELLVVDGHHRLRAYKRAQRKHVPATVQSMTWREASHASKLANLTGAKMAMMPAQKRNALWHHLGQLSEFGARPPPDRLGAKSTSARFGVSRDTLRSMLRRLPEVDPREYPREQRDAITGWPHWKAVATSRGDMFRAMTEESREAWKARKVAVGLARLKETWGMVAMLDGAALLIAEAKDAETLSEAAELARRLAEGATEGDFADGPADF